MGKDMSHLPRRSFGGFGFLGLCWVFQWLGVQLAFNSQGRRGLDVLQCVGQPHTMRNCPIFCETFEYITWDKPLYFVMIFICPEFSRECNYCVSGGNILNNLFMFSEFLGVGKEPTICHWRQSLVEFELFKVDHFAFIALESMLKEPFPLICPTLNIFI